MDTKKLRTLTEEEINWVVETYGAAQGAGIIILGISALFYIPLGIGIGWLIWG
jgi:hypothetical protein